MAKQNATPETILNIRNAARYLQDHGVDVGEMRMRNLIRTHAAFTAPTLSTEGVSADGQATDAFKTKLEQSQGAFKTKLANSEIDTWNVKQSALDAYIAAVASGTVRNAGNGKKQYKIGLTAEQLVDVEAYTKGKGYGEFARANKNQDGKTKTGKTKAAPSETLEGLLADMDGDDPIASDTLEH